jgi:hypothetical protein
MDEKINLSRLEPALAAQLLAGCERLDPAGLCEAADIAAMAASGHCFAATADNAQAVYVIKIKNGTAWVDACKGFGGVAWANVLLPVIEAQAKGLAAVAFQTARPALIKKAITQGYTVAGVILRKSIQ